MSYRNAVYSLIALVHAFGLTSGVLTFLYSYQFQNWRGILLKAYATLAVIVTVVTIGLFINGWAGTMTNATL